MNEIGTKILQFAKSKAQKAPRDFVDSLQAATNISPPIDFFRRINTNKAYVPYGGVPFKEQMNFATNNFKDAKQGSHLIGYASLLRPFTPNSFSGKEPKMGEVMKKVGSKGWKILQKQGYEM